MNQMDSKFWNEVYRKKSGKDVSWHQDVPEMSLEMISELGLRPEDPVIDIGGGESRLVDALLSRGFQDLTVLDISAVARERLGEKASSIKFIASDVTRFAPKEQYMLWHDRATFHFLTSRESIQAYLEIASRAVAPGGFLIVSTFSKSGPDKCSGLSVSQYSERDLKALFDRDFVNLRCVESTHLTPWGTPQDFVYCGFKKRV